MPAPRLRALLALLAVYVIWGSTYLAIAIAIETLPPFLMGGTRFVIAGLLMYVWASFRGAARPTRPQLVTAAITGTLLLAGGNGAVIWSEQFIPSGAAALVVATVPIWIVLVDWIRPRGERPNFRIAAGLVAGFFGTALLVIPAESMGSGLAPIPVLVVVAGALSWAIGSVITRYTEQHPSPAAAVGLNMLAGGAALFVMATFNGEWTALNLTHVSARSIWALSYLIVFGAVIAYSAYLWLLRNVPLATASTYAYVNPVVAVILGWLLLSEPLTPRMLAATTIIVPAVLMITSGGRRAPTR